MKEEQQRDLEKRVLEQLFKGESLFGKDGALGPMLQSFLDKALEAEMEAHLDDQERSKGNKRNGKGTKTLKTGHGSIQVTTPQDRHSSFSPELVKKRQTLLADSLSDKIIGLYGLGMSYRDICDHIKEMYDTEISHSVLTEITDRILTEITEWQSRPLEPMYCIVWMDAMHIKVKEDGEVRHKALYNILGVTREGSSVYTPQFSFASDLRPAQAPQYDSLSPSSSGCCSETSLP